MEPKMDSGSSVPAMFAAYSRRHKRKKFLNKEDNYSSTASSANAHGPLAMKLQKTSEASAICNFQHGLDRSEFGSVTEDIEVLHARKLPLQRLCSQLNPIPFMHLDVEKKRLVNQKTTRVSRCDVIDLEDDRPQGHVIASDIPVIILDSDEEDSGYQKYSHRYCKDALSGPAHKLSMKDLAATDCQVKAAIDEARSPPANNDVQLDKSGYTDSENVMQIKDSAKVKASRDVVGGLPDECNIQVDKSPYSGMKSDDQVGGSEHVKNSMDVTVDFPGKCNIQVDLSLYAGKENNMVIKEGKESAYACMESRMVTKEDSHHVDAEDYGLSKIDTVVNNFEDDRALGHVTEAGLPVIIIDSDEEDSGPAHELSMKGLTVKDCQGVEDLKDEARSSPAKYCVQVDKTGYADTKSYIQFEDSEDVKDSRGVAGGSLAECNVQGDESPYSGVESDVQVRDSEKSKDSWNVIEDLCGNFSILSLYAGMESYGVLKEENHRIGTEGDASVDNETECATHIRDGEKVNASRDAVEGSPAECNIPMDERAHADMENHMVIKEDNHQINVDDDGLAKFDTEEDILDEDSKKVEASRDAIEGSLDTRNIQVDETAYVGMENYGVLKEESNQIGAEDDAFVDNETECATQIRDGQKVNASRDAVEGLPTECNIPVDERAHAGMENHMVIKEDNHQINVEYDGLAKIDTEDDIQDRDSKKVEASRDAIEGSLDKCNIQVDERAYAGMENCMARKEDTQKIGVQDDVLSKIDSKDDIQGTEGKQVKAVRVMVEELPPNCSIKVDENPNTGMGNIMAIEESNHQIDVEDDGLADIWKEMAFALEYSKESAADPAIYECVQEDEEECDHSFVLKDDLGYVCRVCGVIQRSIDTVFEFQYAKKRNMRTYAYEPKNTNGKELIDAIPVGINSPDLMVTEIAAHPRHSKEMKPHQVEGFNFLCRNLVADNPGGCILAHAPGSGKTFMIISFLQSFLAKYPDARPLVVLPKGILSTWKKEFEIWQVDNIPLHDFYTSKAENRSQQLDVLRRWVKERSILFLGYKQLSVIVCDSSKVGAECQDILLKIPTILILDEGHTPRNEETDVLQSLSKIQTPRKVVLSGTLYQNHVKEVFNILNLVRPQFLKLKASRMIVNRIMSRGQISRVRKHLKHGANSAFFDLVEYTLQKDDDFKRKKAVIQDLRQMTSKVLHYYKGDFLDELPGLIDFTVVLNLSARQKEEVQKLRKLDKFKRISLGSAVYMHPQLKNFSQICFATGEKGSNIDDKKIDAMLENLDVREGVKTKFFLNVLRLCESAGEKLLVFSQYILPLKLLERLSAKVKGWSLGKELFMITGDSNTEQRELCMEHFNGSPGAKVFFGSIKACGEGISLVGASRILILDVHLNPSVTRQAIGRAFRPGQKKKVYTYRLVAADSPEQEDYLTCSKKELISKMWFEWNEYCGDQDFEVKTIDVNECGDMFFESPGLREDVNVLYKR